MRPGRHGSMPSGELESIISRNGEFITVRRAGSGDGYAGVYNSVTCEFLTGIGGGTLPEYSRMANPKWGCECTPKGFCETGNHGTNLIRGWRNSLYELLARGRLRPSKEIKRALGELETQQARDYGMWYVPGTETSPAWKYSGIHS